MDLTIAYKYQNCAISQKGKTKYLTNKINNETLEFKRNNEKSFILTI